MQLYAADIAPLVEPVRDAARRLVRELGFMQSTLAGSGLSPSAVHALIEIGRHGTRTGAELAAALALEKSSVSRLLARLCDGGLLRPGPARDGRERPLALTRKGRATLAAIDGFARGQVAEALAKMPPPERIAVADGLSLYADALAGRRGAPAADGDPVAIVAGYRPGLLGRCAEMHARFYARHAGFGRYFEARVAGGLAGFAGRLDNPRNGIWAAVRRDTVLGTIAIDGEDLGEDTAHLRWFIVDDGLRGTGAGRRLLQAALAFCDAGGFRETRLWTFRGLDAARHLYEARGFALAREWSGRQWGDEVMEQLFVRPRPA